MSTALNIITIAICGAGAIYIIAFLFILIKLLIRELRL